MFLTFTLLKYLERTHSAMLELCVFCFQNNVLELWSLFDFLMPGFLGTEKQFQARFGKPILQSRDAKSSSKEQEAGMSVCNRLMLSSVYENERRKELSLCGQLRERAK